MIVILDAWNTLVWVGLVYEKWKCVICDDC